MIPFAPADHKLICPLPKLVVFPSDIEFDATPAPASGTDAYVFAPVSSVHPIFKLTVAGPGVAHVAAESR